MVTVVMSGLISLQLANEPGVPYSAGRFSSLTAAAVDMHLTHPPSSSSHVLPPAGGATGPAVGALRSGQPGPGHRPWKNPVVTAYEAASPRRHRPTELSPERWSGRTRSSRTARARF
jgi:hypothetical protein